MTFQCSHCGKEHETLPELAYQRPDDVWSLSSEEKTQRVSGSNDLCVLAGAFANERSRHFIRGIIPLPIVGVDDTWAIGLWVEVSEQDFVRYRHLYDKDASQDPKFAGVVANSPKSFEDAFGSSVMVQLGTASERPTFWFSAEAAHSLAKLQSSGITLEHIHRVVG